MQLKQATLKRVTADEPLDECLVCGCKELFIRKNFSQRLGVAVVVIAATSSAIAWAYYMWYTAYGILFAAAAAGFVLVLHGRQFTAMLSVQRPSIAASRTWTTMPHSVSKLTRSIVNKQFDSRRAKLSNPRGYDLVSCADGQGT